ncbi:DUF1906 domain-containing protein [Micromonospora sp. BL4]|uniref:DUF1906 domain-containing protein n=1 Tax=Micromonospora sp. BL4 TaxID=2478710 RepID=UPI001F34CBE6|nr:DUF1906 domain-containing protein [Micromonospora sp. BL4]
MTLSPPRLDPRRGSHRVLAALAVVVFAMGAGLTGAARPAWAAAAYNGPQPGTFTGLGFDTCAAPSNAAMKAWLQSPYRAVGIYIGGVNRGCAQPNLTPSWVATQQAAGWRLFPLYVGLQAPCSTYQRKIDPARAAAQGREAADDAVRNARSLGLSLASTITLDMENYPAGNAACTAAVNSFVSAWTLRLHQLRFLSGFYTKVTSAGLADQVAVYQRPGHARPDVIDFARWDGVQTVSDSALPASYWMPGRRMKQYQGDHHETWGGVRINIDSNYLDLRQPRLQPSWLLRGVFRDQPRTLNRLGALPPTR